ncbi:hypothetical protein [Mucilaginibacter agri]|uniref:DUF4397 domain-containing protein n=1 Tax=Mucilaginibacter agri TaxID=2695265 RepID=A0A965ZGR4_9SPHI|nr:hypothetical protein [Mucilaginibacter agri]NCD69853.1 hypothetical protein [Mucilaginibacter agri]
MNLNRLRDFLLLLLLSVLFVSCAKVDGTDTPTTTDAQLIVSFSSAGIPLSSTDSMITYFTSSKDTIRRKAVRGGSFYSVSYTGLPSGSYQALCKVYTNADTTNTQYMYRYSTNITTTAGTTLTGPTNKAYDQWAASFYFYNSTYNLTAAIAKTPGDPYYEINALTTLPYKYIYLSRNVYATSSDSVQYVVKYGNSIIKTAGYKGFHSNQTDFASFAKASVTSYNAGDCSFELYNEVSDQYKVLYSKVFKF